MQKYIKLSEWAKNNSYTYRGAFGAFKKGKIEGAKQLESGAIVVEVDEDLPVDTICPIVAALNEINKTLEKLTNK
jgi:hypothetical protein